MPRKSRLTAAVPPALATVSAFAPNAALAREQTTSTPTPTPTPTTGVKASHVDAAFPQDLVVGLLVAALVVLAAAVLVVRRARRES